MPSPAADTAALPGRPAPPRRLCGIPVQVLLGGAAGVALTAVLLTVLWWPRSDVTYRSSAPSSVTYEDDSAHHLGLVHEHTLSGRHSYQLVIGRDPGLSYGHRVGVDTDLGADGIESTTWTTSGVRVRFPTGHEVFVPAKFFLYGR
ncbi:MULTISPECIES: hypothetical protein [Streptomyces]|uniref:Uncharacterized protein n=1 Tax=Streptomyces achmelvichensis TaxID=3134111 RepID=A0ACC6Q4S3_9ACTN|nr:hypothetical protein OG317_31410 [Streptomyces sp. NBC_01167]